MATKYENELGQQLLRMSGLEGFPFEPAARRELLGIIQRYAKDDIKRAAMIVDETLSQCEHKCPSPWLLKQICLGIFPPPRYEPCAICAGHTGWQIVLRQQPSGEVHSGAKRCPCGAIPNMAQATAEERSHEGQMSAAESAAFEAANMAFMRKALAKVRRLPRGHAVDPVAQLAIGEYREKRAAGELEGE